MTREDVLKEFEYTRIDLIALENEPYTAWHEDLMADEIVRLREALKHETQWADAGIDSTEFWQKQRDDLAAKLAAVEAERDALRDELTQQSITLSAEHQRAERILAALREPSEAALKAACVAVVDSNCTLRDVIIAAVAAAEQEVQGER